MKLIDKLKNALFEDDDEEEVAKQVDVEKTIDLEKEEDVKKPIKSRVREKKYEEYEEEEEDDVIKPFDLKMEEKNKTPVIFDDDDFISDTRENVFKKTPKKEEKILYRGSYEAKLEEKSKEKFKPSPIISPVYGILDRNYTVATNESKIDIKDFNSFHIDRNKNSKDELDFDTIRQKAFGETKEVEEDDDSLLYEMKDDETKPEINKITIGDAEEYYDDLGLEYNVDYKISDKVKIKDSNEENDEDNETENAEEKNLYDLIDLMYDRKDE